MLEQIKALATQQEIDANDYASIRSKLQAYERTTLVKKSYRYRDLEAIDEALAVAFNIALFKASKTEHPLAGMYASAHASLANDLGLEMYQESRQHMAEQLSAYLTPEQITKLKTYGRVVDKPYASATLQEVQAAVAELKLTEELQRATSKKNTWRTEIDQAFNMLLTVEHANGVQKLKDVTALIEAEQ